MTKLIRVPDDLYEAIAALALTEHRSITAQATVLLESAILQA